MRWTNFTFLADLPYTDNKTQIYAAFHWKNELKVLHEPWTFYHRRGVSFLLLLQRLWKISDIKITKVVRLNVHNDKSKTSAAH